ncbi:MAG: hypothetical protein WD044_16180, partial [Dongiaceae bacterium]
AMRRYSSLMRRAWDPAARNVPVQPAHNPANTDDRAVAKNPATDVASSSALGRAQRKSFGKANPVARLQNSDFLETESYERLSAAQAAAQKTALLQEVPTAERSKASASLPTIPHQRTPEDWAEIGRVVLERKSLSETDQYVHRYILGFESLGPDTAGNSRGGIQQERLADENFMSLLNAFRILEGRAKIAERTKLSALSPSDLLDMQRVYLANVLDPFNSKDENVEAWLRETAQNDNFLAGWGPPELAAQIADSVFQHGTNMGAQLIQRAANTVLTTLSPEERNRFEMPAQIKVDGALGSISQRVIKSLGSNPDWASRLLRALRERRMSYTHHADALGHGQRFEGATINRIWGIWAP